MIFLYVTQKPYFMLSSKKTIYFEGLNGLRFIAAFAVIVTHIELIKSSFGMKNYWKNPLVFNLGGLGVYFFFVLSGFLITYLLLAEKKRFHTIDIKSFYIRRILRIWPLYYAILFIGFFILPQFQYFEIPYLKNSFSENFSENLILYALILPNLAFALFPAVPNIGQTWSIGVEEQFYLIWPWIILKSKYVVKTLLLIIIGLIAVKVGILILGNFYKDSSWYEPLKLFVAMSKFECMAIGGLGAYFVFTENKLLRYLNHKAFFLGSLLGTALLVFYTPNMIQDGIHLVYSLLFLFMIIYVSEFKKVPFLENSILNDLGKISYGIYMYHFMVIPAVLSCIKPYTNCMNEISFNVIIYFSVIILTIIVSKISYSILEKPIIKMKDKYAIIKSGEK